ncbi:transketolase [Bosea lathyri]|uniref:Transketolase n=1 Tax=Bosea lathyri TaxID=1036778 RepID=A0A1H6DA90_9HYPH|nr:transketolase [Bosea lathyri]
MPVSSLSRAIPAASLDLAELKLMANALRALTMDAIEQAKSGHPGMPLGMADVAAVLFSQHLKFDPADPAWPDRDRLILSAGHGSMLLYAALHLLGYEDMPLDELKRFRTTHSRAAGHPEYGHAGGIETTTGPLGQGLATAIGFALAERLGAAHFGKDIVDHRTYVIASDGDLMEGISQEAIALAGHFKLSRLTVLFDDNNICIDGSVDMVESTDQLARFRASGWHVLRIDGHDPEAISAAIDEARASDRPTLIACRTVIGFSAPTKANKPDAHSSPLGTKEVAGARANLGWNWGPFEIPDAADAAWKAAAARGKQDRQDWIKRFAQVPADRKVVFERCLTKSLPAGLSEAVLAAKRGFVESAAQIPTRKASEQVFDQLSRLLPELISGSADLTSATLNKASLRAITPEDFSGHFVHWGIREHAMVAAMNGLAIEGFIPVGATFLAFSDYFRPALRLSALMGLGTIHVMTHDSIGLGEDGSTHQPVEHLAALRAMPNLLVLRPADGIETAEAWEIALQNRKRPTILALTRQPVPQLRQDAETQNRSALGAYEIAAANGEAQVSLFSSGSEVQLALAARDQLESEGIATRVVSVPSFELFAEQPASYRAAILGTAPVRVAVEAAVRQSWDGLIGIDGDFIGMNSFGASGPAEELYELFGITAKAVADAARQQLKRKGVS